MARRRAQANSEAGSKTLTPDVLDRILEAGVAIQADALNWISTDLIDPNPYQTRRHFDDAALRELAGSIESQGFYGHLLAREVGGRFQIAYGERRLRAARLVGLSRVPMIVRDFTDLQMMEVAITENVIREDLNPVEEAEGYRHLQNAGYSLRRISERVGKSPGHISMLLGLLAKEDIAESVRQERLGVREAHEIAKLEDPARRQELIDRAARGELNREAVRQAVRLAQQETEFRRSRQIPVSTNDEDSASAHFIELDDEEQAIVPQGGQIVPQPAEPFVWQTYYDPLPNLRAALKRLEKIRLDRFEEMDTFTQSDAAALLKEMIARAQYMLKQLEEPWEPPANK